MSSNQFFQEPYFVKGSSGHDNIKAFLEKEIKTKFPFNQKNAKKIKSSEGLSYKAVLTRSLKEVTTSLYQLYYKEIPIKGQGINLSYETNSFGILSISYACDEEEVMSKIASLEVYPKEKEYDSNFIIEALDINRNILRLKALKIDLSEFEYSIKINSENEVIYQYTEKNRQHSHHESKEEHIENLGIFPPLPQLKIPDLDKSIKEGDFYHSTELMFSAKMPWGDLNWLIIIDHATNSILHEAVLADNLGGFVYNDAPSAMTGDTSILPNSSVGQLNAIRNPSAIPNLNSAIPPYNLSGQYVELAELSLPANSYPSTSNNFNYDVNTEEFAAVNAYVHNDYLFRLVADMGFDMSVYFDGTSFPVPVDHNGFFGCVNACAPGNALGNGSGGFHYGTMMAGSNVGISLSKRITLHEFGHAVLWDNVHSPNLGFCHSVGDSLAAVLMDPRSVEPDRFLTFPWLTLANPGIDRRHDRDVNSGWDWYGPNDDGAYGSEQILSSTHFRLYQALGGDSHDLCTREWAARYTAYLIFYGVGSLTPVTNSNSPEHWARVLMQADLATIDFECQIGRTIHKVIRWAFEKQNAFNGKPPGVDIYINDGRNGEYNYAKNICDSTEIWNRHNPDNGNDHQIPEVGKVNYAYVIVHNRGNNDSGPVAIQGFKTVSNCCTKSKEELCWPTDFISLQKKVLHEKNIAANSYEVIGPFAWIPCSKNDSLLFSASCKRDQSNINLIRSGFSTNANKLARFDNNIAFRKTCNTIKCC